MADALDCVEIELVVEIVTMEPDRFMFSDWTVILRAPSEEASAVIWPVEPSIRLKPLKTAFEMIEVIWSRRAVKSSLRASRLAVSRDWSDAASAFCFI